MFFRSLITYMCVDCYFIELSNYKINFNINETAVV